MARHSEYANPPHLLFRDLFSSLFHQFQSQAGSLGGILGLVDGFLGIGGNLVSRIHFGTNSFKGLCRRRTFISDRFNGTGVVLFGCFAVVDQIFQGGLFDEQFALAGRQGHTVRGSDGLENGIDGQFEVSNLVFIVTTVLVRHDEGKTLVEVTSQQGQVNNLFIPDGVEIIFDDIGAQYLFVSDEDFINGIGLVAQSKIGIGQVHRSQLHDQFSRTRSLGRLFF
mmetsp:Transcript_18514/g.35169  ORF Transcript_18514/g.35169 Transcript_18514/m.35169 type:complete len:224 (-) Transcript_18514:1096-1767(-)